MAPADGSEFQRPEPLYIPLSLRAMADLSEAWRRLLRELWWARMLVLWLRQAAYLGVTKRCQVI